LVVALVGGCGRSESPAPSPPTAQQGDSATSVRYLALGDSLSQGVGAPDEQTGAFPALLAEKWRGEGCEVELQNAGSAATPPSRC
jgi:lysophospholipase L1-like esterase